MITSADETLLRRAIGLAARAVALGDAPYGSPLADENGTVSSARPRTRSGATTTSAPTPN